VGDAATINFEKLSALKPDLILALYAGVTQEQYDLLTQIAPTVAQPAAYVDYGIPWQELTRTVGLAVGQAEAADQLVKEVEARFEQALAEHPEFEGATSIVATPYEGIWVYAGEDVRGRFLNALGFKLPEGLAEVTGEEFGGNLSFERADLLDVDVIIWLDADEAQGPLGGPVYQNLAVHTEGREVHLDSYDDPLGGATSFVSVLRRLGILPQAPVAPEGLTVRELVAQGRYPHQSWLQQWRVEDEAAVNRALTITGMAGLAERPADALSGGQRQRAWIAMTLAQETELLLLDEPTTFLDLAHQLEILHLLERLNQEEGRTVVMVVHDLNHASRHARHIIALREGRIAAAGRPAEVITPTILRSVFGVEADIVPDPRTGAPLCIPYGLCATPENTP
jgi:ABC-type cobalamin/Fe3+-siderophores transport system ATPase subunit